MPAAEFDAWLRARGGAGARARERAGAARAVAVPRAGCGACHAVRGTAATGTIGPDLTHLGGRRSIGIDTLPLDAREPRALHRRRPARQARQPHARVPRASRPTSCDALAAYLAEPEVSAMATPRHAPRRLSEPAAAAARRAGGSSKRVWALPQGWRIVTAVNNTVIGYFYVGTAFLFFLLAGILALLMRAAARGAEQHVPQPGDLQPDLHDARHGDDVPVRRAGGRGDGHPAAAADARRARPAVPAARRLRVLGLFRRRARSSSARLFFDLAPTGGWFMYPPLTSAQYLARASARTSGCSASASSRSRRSPARSRSSSACCARARPA